MTTTALEHTRQDFWFTTHLTNPVLRLVLRGPLGRFSGKKLAIVRYRGRRSRTDRSLIAQ